MDDLDTLLKGEDAQPKDEAKPDTVKAETGEAPAETEAKGDAPAAGETDTATGDTEPTPGSQDKETGKSTDGQVPITALLDEREKRQAAERRATELEARQTPQQVPERPDPITDPEGARDHDNAALDQRLFVERLNMSEAMHRNTEGGNALVDRAQAEFMKACEANPALMQDLRRQADPYGFAIKYVRDRETLAEIGDPAEYRKKVETEILAKMKAETESKAKADDETRSELPESLAGEQSVAGRSSSAFTGPEPMKDILA